MKKINTDNLAENRNSRQNFLFLLRLKYFVYDYARKINSSLFATPSESICSILYPALLSPSIFETFRIRYLRPNGFFI